MCDRGGNHESKIFRKRKQRPKLKARSRRKRFLVKLSYEQTAID
jgi:hypothetical protein